MPAHKITALRKSQYKMQKQRRLQKPGCYVAPIDRPVEGIELSREVESVKDKRNQAEDIKMRRTLRRPAAEQYIKPNSQIDKCDQPQPGVLRVIGRDENDDRIHWNRISHQRISCLRPSSYAVDLAFQIRGALNIVGCNGDNLVSGLDPSLETGAICVHTVCTECSG